MAAELPQVEEGGQTGALIRDGLPASLLHQRRLLFNRELSWLEFNRRVLEEAQDESHPLLERLKFLSIFSTNLDEFFMVRVSGLKEEIEEDITEPSPDGMSPAEQLQEIGARLRPMLAEQMRCLREDVLPALAEEGIVITPYAELSKRERRETNDYFLKKVFPVLTPQAVDPGHPFPYISNLSLNLGLMVEPSGKGARNNGATAPRAKGERFARIKLPPTISRLVPVGGKGSRFTFLGSVISANLETLFPGMRHGRPNLFRVTRDADFDIREDEAGDLLSTMKQHLRRRRFGQAVRLEVSCTMPAEMVGYLTESLHLTPDDVYVVEGPLSVPDLMDLYQLDRPELKDRPLQTTVPKTLLRRGPSFFDVIRRKDVLLHHPFTSYSVVTDFIRTAAADPDVLAIKMCLYRTGKDSPVVSSLMEASEAGKQVAALVELKARFDEENNIEWARRLEQAGVHVVYGLMGLKTHSKLALIVRREGDALRRYVHIATGNYNPVTSRVYTDVGLFTADEEIGEDASNVFNYLTGYSSYAKYHCLLVAPVNMRERLTALVERETEHARAGRPARIIAKCNSLTDVQIIRTLYEASQAGVTIDLIVRGVCMLRPGVKGLSETITVRSVVGRFLEHSRIFYFGNDGHDEVYIGSADWMYRNLNRRVEVMTPVKNGKLRKYLREVVLEAYLRDNVKARLLRKDGTYERVAPEPDAERVSSQEYLQLV